MIWGKCNEFQPQARSIGLSLYGVYGGASFARLAVTTADVPDPNRALVRLHLTHLYVPAYDTSEWQNCGNSTLSAHVFSEDGKAWHMLKPNVEPYSHTVRYADGTQHSYSTLERPNLHFNSKGQMTHINLVRNRVLPPRVLSPNTHTHTHSLSLSHSRTHSLTLHTHAVCGPCVPRLSPSFPPRHPSQAANMESEDDGCPNYEVCPAKREHCACTNCKYADHAGTIIIALAIDE